MKERLLIIGFDGATFDLIEPWAESGALPTFQRLMREGCRAPLMSVVHPFTAQAWTSMVTGVNAGKHRIFDFWERQPEVYGFHLATARRRGVPALWALLSRAERDVIVVNVPMTFPPEPVRGVMVSGWDTPGTASEFTFPASLKTDLPRLAGGRPYVIVPDDWRFSLARRPDKVLSELEREIDVRFDVAAGLMKQEAWDLCFFVVNALDGAAHFLWAFHDAAHPLHDAAARGALFGEDPLLRVYARADRRLGSLLSTLPSDVRVLIVSDHGEGPLGPATVHLNLWLERQGLLQFRRDGAVRSLRSRTRRLLSRAADRGKRFLYTRVTFDTLQRLRHLWPDKARTFLSEEAFFADVDWKNTLAYSEEFRGNIWINVRGRDPQGTVEPGGAYEELRDRILAAASELRDPMTGRPIVNRAWKREELFHGPYVDLLPDILLESDYPDIFSLRSGYREHEPVRLLSNDELRRRPITGCHRPRGIFVAWGDDIVPGGSAAPLSIMDVAPTALYLLGEPVPTWMDGRVAERVISADRLRRVPVRFSDVPANTGTTADGAEADQAMVGRLKGLGYF